MMEEYNINQTTLAILALYRGNYRRACYLREIARDVGIDVKAVQLQVKRLERLNILASTRRGRITEYRLNLANVLTRYFLVLAEAFATAEYLAKNFAIKKLVNELGDAIDGGLILFGSFARGQARRESDIDAMVITEKRVNRNAFENAGELIGRNVSVKAASPRQFLGGLREGDPLVREVAANHVVLKGIDQFCELMWRYYARQ
jgi:hypothetical protein